MRMRDFRWAPDDRANRGQRGTPGGTPEAGARADRRKPEAESGQHPAEPPPDTEKGGERISGPGANDLTRGLP